MERFRRHVLPVDENTHSGAVIREVLRHHMAGSCMCIWNGLNHFIFKSFRSRNIVSAARALKYVPDKDRRHSRRRKSTGLRNNHDPDKRVHYPHQ